MIERLRARLAGTVLGPVLVVWTLGYALIAVSAALIGRMSPGLSFVTDLPLLVMGVALTPLVYLFVPYWFLLTIPAVLPAGWVVGVGVRRRRAKRLLRANVCPSCGYDLRATPDRCPECGTVAKPS